MNFNYMPDIDEIWPVASGSYGPDSIIDIDKYDDETIRINESEIW
jgi:hypothetical protein